MLELEALVIGVTGLALEGPRPSGGSPSGRNRLRSPSKRAESQRRRLEQFRINLGSGRDRQVGIDWRSDGPAIARPVSCRHDRSLA